MVLDFRSERSCFLNKQISFIIILYYYNLSNMSLNCNKIWITKVLNNYLLNENLYGRNYSIFSGLNRFLTRTRGPKYCFDIIARSTCFVTVVSRIGFFAFRNNNCWLYLLYNHSWVPTVASDIPFWISGSLCLSFVLIGFLFLVAGRFSPSPLVVRGLPCHLLRWSVLNLESFLYSDAWTDIVLISSPGPCASSLNCGVGHLGSNAPLVYCHFYNCLIRRVLHHISFDALPFQVFQNALNPCIYLSDIHQSMPMPMTIQYTIQ